MQVTEAVANAVETNNASNNYSEHEVPSTKISTWVDRTSRFS